MNNLELGFLSADNWQFLDKPTVGSSLLFIFSPQDINCECKQDKLYILHYFKLLTVHKSAFDIILNSPSEMAKKQTKSDIYQRNMIVWDLEFDT